jgi:hypothetical protein
MTKDKSRDLIDPKVSGAINLKFRAASCNTVGVCPATLTWRSSLGEMINGSLQGLLAKLSPLKTETFRPARRSRGTGGYSNAGVTFGAVAGLAR